jgi:hypothetical protein
MPLAPGNTRQGTSRRNRLLQLADRERAGSDYHEEGGHRGGET